MSINILGIVQARCSSSRLPMKVLKPILGTPMIIHQLRRIQRAKCLDDIILATSLEASDDALAETVIQAGFQVFRGSLNHVLERFYCAAQQGGNYDHIVRMTGDCPVTDPEIIDQIIQSHCDQGNDYTTNAQDPSFPHGLDVEIMTTKGLMESYQHAKLPSEKEHVTLYLKNHPETYQIKNIYHQPNLSHYRWTVDELTDFVLVEKIYQNLYPDNPNFSMTDILRLMQQQPELCQINQGIDRHEGLNKSLGQDQDFLLKQASHQ